MTEIVSIDVVKELNQARGEHWFDEKTMAYFGSVIESAVVKVNDKFLFITSEQDSLGMAWDGERRYTLRCSDQNGDITDINGFGNYRTLEEATTAMLKQAQNV